MHTVFFFACLAAVANAPTFLEDRFDLPPGFRIYKAAGPDLTGGSYDICFDGQGRLLVGDGSQVRRLMDSDADGIFDAGEVIAKDLGPRGPQGLLAYGDRLYAVGGDGIQLYEGYSSGNLVHRGRIGKRISTGGDHDAHTIFRGHDGHIYFITGDGGGAKERLHITEESSPALFERSCSVFRISPDGRKWECIGSGGRNSPNLGMNYLGELFSLDSDMEWHVDLPWWRPVRLHHWIQGGDQGWQDVGAYPPYYVDCLPGIYDVGRGSPDWGVFYEHRQLPEKYRDAYLVCDYLSKSATTGGYETAGRLFAFFLERSGAGWKASMEVLARPRPGAKDADGRPISFALVDIDVAPDGSLFLSDHNQGVWRIFCDPDGKLSAKGAPAIFPSWPALARVEEPEKLIDQLLALPQPASEWSRVREAEILQKLGGPAGGRVEHAVLDRRRATGQRLRALRLVSSGFERLGDGFLALLDSDPAPEVRAQGAWLHGIRGKDAGKSGGLSGLLADVDPFVRRRALEAAIRIADPGLIPVPAIVARLSDPDRLVRYTAMIALSHFPTGAWLDEALAQENAQTRLRALVAADLRREPPPGDVTRRVVGQLLDAASPGDSREDRLDLLRVVGRFQKALRGDEKAPRRVHDFLLGAFPDPDRDIRWEQARLLGEYGVPAAFGPLVAQVEGEKDPVTQFHIAQALSRIPSGWSPDEEERALRWLLRTQHGWFAELAGKGLQFPHFWLTVLTELASRHGEAIARHTAEIDLASQLGGVAVDLIAESLGGGPKLIALYRSKEDPAARKRIASALGGVKDAKAAPFLREEYLRVANAEMRGALLRALARQPPDSASHAILEEGLLHADRDVVRACVQGLSGYKLEPSERLAGRLLSQLLTRMELFHPIERLLMAASGRKRPGFSPDADPGERPADGEVESGHVYWKAWYEGAFGRPFDAAAVTGAPERSDEEAHAFLLAGASNGGNAGRGRAVYIATRCASCHGGAPEPGREARLFGPELAGVTRRLSRVEIADAIVYPSKQVADRFKGVLVQTQDGLTLTGFVTEQSGEALTLVDQERANSIPRGEVILTAPLETSLMPERLLSRLSLEETRDLVAFLEELGTLPDPAGSGAGGASASGSGAAANSAADWPTWRGPGGRGVSGEKEAPEHWSPTQNVAWKANLEGWGNSSPAVTADRVYVTTQTDDDKLHVFALDRATGAVAWRRIAGSGRLKAHQLHNMATPSPAAERDRVYVLFGTGDMACLDRDGSALWQRNLAADHGEYRILWGMGSSPMLQGDLVFTVCTHPGPSYVLAIDKRTGEDVWKVQRDLPCVGEATDSYSSPVFLETAGRIELLVAGRDHVNAYDPTTGRELWISAGLKIDHPYGRTMASPGAGEGVVVACSASVQGLGKMIAVRPGGEGDVTGTGRLWQYEKFTPDCPTPLCYQGHVYVIRDDGIATCIDARSGEVRWKKRLARGDFKASSVACADKVYFLSMDGDCVVQRSGPRDEVIAENHLDGHFIATPAIAGGRIYFRSRDTVYAVESK